MYGPRAESVLASQEAGEAIGHLGWLIFRIGDTEPVRCSGHRTWSWWRDRVQTRAGNEDRDSAAA